MQISKRKGVNALFLQKIALTLILKEKL